MLVSPTGRTACAEAQQRTPTIPVNQPNPPNSPTKENTNVHQPPLVAMPPYQRDSSGPLRGRSANVLAILSRLWRFVLRGGLRRAQHSPDGQLRLVLAIARNAGWKREQWHPSTGQKCVLIRGTVECPSTTGSARSRLPWGRYAGVDCDRFGVRRRKQQDARSMSASGIWTTDLFAQSSILPTLPCARKRSALRDPSQ
jgi:hypothetical protein